MERKKILLIEDEVKLARFVELELKYEGYDVTTCHDGRVGMEMITNQEFDMILVTDDAKIYYTQGIADGFVNESSMPSEVIRLD